jgi:DDE superfamily endonuclease
MVLNLWATMIRDLMIGRASVEDTLTLWASLLREAKQRIRPLFTQDRVAISVGQFLDGLLSNEPRKTGWMRAEAAGDQGPWRQQAILGRGRWDADALRDIVREYALETLCDEDAVLVIDETGFLKQGKASCGVGTSVHWLGRQNHQLPDWRIRLLCVAAWPCLHRPFALPTKGMDGRPRSPEGSACAARCGLCDEA